jgi:hypothetical protein
VEPLSRVAHDVQSIFTGLQRFYSEHPSKPFQGEDYRTLSGNNV